jgi:hypothetical protein
MRRAVFTSRKQDQPRFGGGASPNNTFPFATIHLIAAGLGVALCQSKKTRVRECRVPPLNMRSRRKAASHGGPRIHRVLCNARANRRARRAASADHPESGQSSLRAQTCGVGSACGFGIAVLIGNTISSGILRNPGQVGARLPPTGPVPQRAQDWGQL